MTEAEWKEWLQTKYSAMVVFKYNQVAELKKTFKYRNWRGVCFGMSTDWLRRKLFNDYNPEENQKRNFNDDKYWWRYNRVRLTKKHARLQAKYLQSKDLEKVSYKVGKLAEVSPGKGFDKIQIEVDETDIFRLGMGDYGKASYVDMIDVMGIGKGQLGQIRTTAPVHLIAIHRKSNTRIEIFDPEFGEYAFATSEAASEFLFDLCEGYKEYHQVTGVNFNEATWDQM